VTLADCDFVRLSSSSDILSFACGNDDLDEFLHQDAEGHLEHLLAVTYLFQDSEGTVAFYSVQNDKITYDDLPSKSQWRRLQEKEAGIPHPKRHYKSFPSVKIGRLGVAERCKRQGIGTQVLQWIKMTFVHENKTGCRFITIDAYNTDEAIAFYQSNGFKFLTPEDAAEDTRLMYFDLKPFREAGIDSGQL